MTNLKDTILEILNNEPYKLNEEIESNPIDKITSKIKKNINHSYFKPFNKYVSNVQAKKIVQTLYNYYSTQNLDNKIVNLNNKGRIDKEIKADIQTIKKFLDLLEKNCIYNDSLERNYINLHDDRFVFDYCMNLIKDLKTKEFKKSIQYKRSQIVFTKEEVRKVFIKIAKSTPEIKKYEIDNFMNLLKS